jgi:hypothetical protein
MKSAKDQAPEHKQPWRVREWLRGRDLHSLLDVSHRRGVDARRLWHQHLGPRDLLVWAYEAGYPRRALATLLIWRALVVMQEANSVSWEHHDRCAALLVAANDLALRGATIIDHAKRDELRERIPRAVIERNALVGGDAATKVLVECYDAAIQAASFTSSATDPWPIANRGVGRGDMQRLFVACERLAIAADVLRLGAAAEALNGEASQAAIAAAAAVEHHALRTLVRDTLRWDGDGLHDAAMVGRDALEETFGADAVKTVGADPARPELMHAPARVAVDTWQDVSQPGPSDDGATTITIVPHLARWIEPGEGALAALRDPAAGWVQHPRGWLWLPGVGRYILDAIERE